MSKEANEAFDLIDKIDEILEQAWYDDLSLFEKLLVKLKLKRWDNT